MTPEDSARFEVELTRSVLASAEQAYDAFTRPDLLSKWFTKSATADLRVGGRYGNADHDEGEFLVLDRPARLHFTWENAGHCPGTIVEIGFVSREDGSVRISLRHRGIETAEGRDDMELGWSWALDSLRSFLEKGVPIAHSEWEAARKARG